MINQKAFDGLLVIFGLINTCYLQKTDFLCTLEVKKVGLVNLLAEDTIIYFEKFYSSKYNLQHCLSLVCCFLYWPKNYIYKV